jgi:hypothetical protein
MLGIHINMVNLNAEDAAATTTLEQDFVEQRDALAD